MKVKNKIKYVLLVVGIVFIVFGALIPTMFKPNSDLDQYTYKRNAGFSSYSLTINIISKKEYQINGATITMQDAFNKHNTLNKTLNSPSATKKIDGDNYVYTFVVTLTQDEYFDYSKISSVKISTSIGERTAKEDAHDFSRSWITPAMIIIIFFGSGMVLGSIMIFIYPKIRKSAANNIRHKVKIADSSIRLEHMSDDEVLNKYENYLEEKAKKAGINLDEVDEKGNRIHDVNELFELIDDDYIKMFGGEVASEATSLTCSYCGSENDLCARKCSSCGANLSVKKRNNQ